MRIDVNYIEAAREVLQIEQDALGLIKDRLDGGFERGVELMLETLESGGKIVITGMGKSFHVGQKVAATLTSTGSPASVMHPSEAMHGDFGILQQHDILLVLSYSGASDELIALIPMVKRLDVRVITVTGVTDSPLAVVSDAVIPITVEREACPFNMAPTSSTTATMAMGDAIAMVLLKARGFDMDDYARLHPGGAIGRTLLLHVEDIMRKEDRVASVSEEAVVKDAVLAMTRARAGSVAVVDQDNRVKGIFTDGDFRRHFDDLANLAEKSIQAVMTADPVTVRSDALAVDVLSIFETHQIDDLLVVDSEGRLSGLVDIQDLPKLKIL